MLRTLYKYHETLKNQKKLCKVYYWIFIHLVFYVIVSLHVMASCDELSSLIYFFLLPRCRSFNAHRFRRFGAWSSVTVLCTGEPRFRKEFPCVPFHQNNFPEDVPNLSSSKPDILLLCYVFLARFLQSKTTARASAGLAAQLHYSVFLEISHVLRSPCDAEWSQMRRNLRNKFPQNSVIASLISKGILAQQIIQLQSRCLVDLTTKR